jgi:hypothetical protein
MSEEAFLRYRMAVAERMPDCPSKRALIIAIQSRMKVLRVNLPGGLGIETRGAQLPPDGPRP